MTNFHGTTSGKKIELKETIDSGGEGDIRKTNIPNLLAKIYHKPVTPEQVEKLKIMIENPPENSMSKKGHTSIAWPQELIQNSDTNQIVGFLMSEINNGKTLINIYNHYRRSIEAPGLNWLIYI